MGHDTSMLWSMKAEEEMRIRKEAKNEGRNEGRNEGMEKGRKDEQEKAKLEKIEIAKDMKNDDLPISKIIKYTGLTAEEIMKL